MYVHVPCNLAVGDGSSGVRGGWPGGAVWRGLVSTNSIMKEKAGNEAADSL